MWQWCLVERAVPQVVKQAAARAYSRGQTAAGIVGQDDTENFERIAEATRTPLSRRVPLHYGMALGYDGEWPGQDQWHTEGLPGLVGPRFWETAQRRFYGYWAQLMGQP